jgi:hypothetical protein
MTALSRRQFLKRSGAAALFGVNAPALAAIPAGETPAIMGRAFTLSDVYSRPDASSEVIGRLLPDAVTPILETLDTPRNGVWYRVARPAGYLPAEAVQPILPYSRPEVAESVGGGLWAEVVAPYSAVRQWCAGAAPIVARLGFGAIVYMIDRLVDDQRQVWYGLTDVPGSALIGWSPALQYAPWQPESHQPLTAIVVRRSKLHAYAGKRRLAEIGYYGPALAPMTTTISVVQPGAAYNAALPLGVSWLMQLAAGPRLYGAYWHNRSGVLRGDDPDIELSTLAARWLYARLASSPQPVPLIAE